MNKEQLRLQMLSGVITESEYRIKLAEAEEVQAIAAAEKIEDSIENKINVDSLSDEKKDQLRNALIKLGVTSNSSIEDVADKIEDKIEATLSEAEEDPNKKIANALSAVGGGLLASHFVPLIPLIVGHMAGIGFAGGLGITLGISGALIGLAKALGAEEVKESLNEHYVVGGIVGIGAINNPFEGRVKESYEDAFEHFLGERYETKFENREQDPYTMNEEEEEEEEDYGTNIVTGKKLPKPDPIVEEGLNENVGSTLDKMLQTFEFSEKGNDEMIEFGNYLLSPEGPKNIAQSIKFKLKQTDQIPGQMYYGDKEALEAFLSKLK